MRIAALAVLGLLAAAPLSHGQEATGWAAKLLRTEDGKIPTGHDFGTVPRGALLRHRFPMTNIYSVPLQIMTSVSCGCVAAEPTPKVLQPRETGYLDVTMDTTKFQTPNKRVELYVTVISPNQQYSSTTALTITGTYRMDVTLNPAQAEFGVVPRGQPAVRDVRVSYAGQLNWQIAATPNESAPFDVQVLDEARRAGRVDYRVRLTLKADAPAGTHRGELNLATNDPNNRQIPIPYDVTVQAPLTAVPDAARFGAVKADALSKRSVMIRGSRPFRITGVDGQGEGLTAEFAPDAKATHVLTLNLQPAQAGALQRILTVKTDLDNSTVTVKVEAMVQQ
jgi:hypothetical protein